jgi:hypothetical protein
MLQTLSDKFDKQMTKTMDQHEKVLSDLKDKHGKDIAEQKGKQKELQGQIEDLRK